MNMLFGLRKNADERAQELLDAMEEMWADGYVPDEALADARGVCDGTVPPQEVLDELLGDWPWDQEIDDFPKDVLEMHARECVEAFQWLAEAEKRSLKVELRTRRARARHRLAHPAVILLTA